MKRCPFCHEHNDCSVQSDQACWCFNTHVPSGLLALLSEGDVNRACVCQQCIEKYRRSPVIFERHWRSNDNKH
ncbi:cysteine-rich CWC family protein [Marinomonas profundimaris]|uniref:cysteine-rich CWC family protein n=1 Tax=Marinomonas profundimaris TaxID=1208321 RepID=UPI0009FC3803